MQKRLAGAVAVPSSGMKRSVATAELCTTDVGEPETKKAKLEPQSADVVLQPLPEKLEEEEQEQEEAGEPKKRPAIHEAVICGDVVRVKQLLAADAGCVHSTDDNGWTPLHWASFLNRPQSAELLLQAGSQVNLRAKNIGTPLHTAALQGNYDIVRMLLRYNADVAMRDWDRTSSSYYASRGGNISVLKLLKDTGASMDSVTLYGTTALHLATAFGHVEAVEWLISEAHVGVNDCDSIGITALHRAALCGHSQLIRRLIDAGADVNKPDNSMATPLHFATRVDNVENIRTLLAAGADINARDVNRWTPLLYGCMGRQRYPHIISELLDNGADLLSTTDDGMTSLHWCAIGVPEILGVLLEKGGRRHIDIRDDLGNTPLAAAARNGHVRCVRMLIEHGASAEATKKPPLLRLSKKVFEQVALPTTSNLRTNFSALRNDELFSDIKIVVGEREFTASRVILASNEYFYKLLKSGMRESREGRIEVDEIDPDLFAEFLDFLYGGRLPENMPPARLLGLWLIGDRFREVSLLDAVVLQLRRCLTIQTSQAACEELLNLGIENDQLFKVVFGYYLENYHLIAGTSSKQRAAAKETLLKVLGILADFTDQTKPT